MASNRAKKAKKKLEKSKQHVRDHIIPRLIDLQASTTKQTVESTRSEEVVLFDKDSKEKTWFTAPANLVTNTSWKGETLFLGPKQGANILTFSKEWNAMSLNTYGDFVRKDWRLTFSYEVLNHLGFDLETINKAKKDYHHVMSVIENDENYMLSTEFSANRDGKPYIPSPVDKKSKKNIGFPALSCWSTCQRFVAIAENLPWKLCEGYIQGIPGDSMTANDTLGMLYYHAWLELDGVIIDPVARNVVRKMEAYNYQDRNKDGSLKTVRFGGVFEAVAPVFRPDIYRPIVKRSKSDGLLKYFMSLQGGSVEDWRRAKVLRHEGRWATYTWRSQAYRELDKNKGRGFDVNLDQVDFKLDPSDEIIESPAHHLAFFCQQNTPCLINPIMEGNMYFDFPYDSKKELRKLFREDILASINSPAFLDLIASDKVDPALRQEIEQHKEAISDMVAKQQVELQRKRTKTSIAFTPWFSPRTVAQPPESDTKQTLLSLLSETLG